MGLNRFLVIAGLLLFAGEVAVAQTGSIRGTVRDSVTLGALGGADVIVAGTKLRAETNLYGRYAVRGLPAGVYALEFRYPGFTPLRLESIRLAPGKTLVRDAYLKEPVPDTSSHFHIIQTIKW